MKKRIALLIMSFFCFIGITIAISWAWFLNNELVTPDVSGYSASAYFAGGDGSEENPYQIASPKHLYNLAWLQYLGVFNQPGCTDEDGKVIQCELYDIIEFEGQQYALLVEADAQEDAELVLMKYTEEDGESYFETIENDEEFDRVSAYIETLDDEDIEDN